MFSFPPRRSPCFFFVGARIYNVPEAGEIYVAVFPDKTSGGNRALVEVHYDAPFGVAHGRRAFLTRHRGSDRERHREHGLRRRRPTSEDGSGFQHRPALRRRRDPPRSVQATFHGRLAWRRAVGVPGSKDECVVDSRVENCHEHVRQTDDAAAAHRRDSRQRLHSRQGNARQRRHALGLGGAAAGPRGGAGCMPRKSCGLVS